MTVDCMACLVALARGLPGDGAFTDSKKITHATLRMQNLYFITCTIRPDPDRPGEALIDRFRTRTVQGDR